MAGASATGDGLERTAASVSLCDHEHAPLLTCHLQYMFRLQLQYSTWCVCTYTYQIVLHTNSMHVHYSYVHSTCLCFCYVWIQCMELPVGTIPASTMVVANMMNLVKSAGVDHHSLGTTARKHFLVSCTRHTHSM